MDSLDFHELSVWEIDVSQLIRARGCVSLGGQNETKNERQEPLGLTLHLRPEKVPYQATCSGAVTTSRTF
jgi:hypothetical protein